MQKKTTKIVLLSALFLSLAGVVVFAYNNRPREIIDQSEAEETEYQSEEYADELFEEEGTPRNPGIIQSFADKLSTKFSEAGNRKANSSARQGFRYSDDEFGTFL